MNTNEKLRKFALDTLHLVAEHKVNDREGAEWYDEIVMLALDAGLLEVVPELYDEGETLALADDLESAALDKANGEHGCGAVGPEGYRCTHHEKGEHVARGTEPGSFAEAWPI